MGLKDSFSTIFLASWTIFWLAFSIGAFRAGYINYNSRSPSRATYTAEDHPVAYYTLLSISGACVLLGVFLTISHIRSALRDARFREAERRSAEKRKAERRAKRQKFPALTDKQKASLVRRACEELRGESRARKERRNKG